MGYHDLARLKKEVEDLRPEDQIELANYLLAKARPNRASDEAFLSEKVLARDWLSPEEDQAWASL